MGGGCEYGATSGCGTYHDKHVFVTVESLTIIRHWTRVKNLLLYLEVVAFVYLSILINNPP